MANLSLQRFDKDGIELLINTQTGESFATAKGYSRMSGKDYDTIKKRCQRGGLPSAEIPTGQGFRWGTLISEDLIAEWLPKDNPAMASQLMKLGVRAFLHHLAGYEITSTAIAPTHKIPQTYAEALLEAGRLALENEKLSAKIEQDAPLVEFANEVKASNDSIDFNAFAKTIGTGRTRLFRLMRECGVIMQNSNLPYQKWCDAGYFEVSQEIDTRNDRLIPFALVTGKGQIWLHDRLKKHHLETLAETSLFQSAINFGNV